MPKPRDNETPSTRSASEPPGPEPVLVLGPAQRLGASAGRAAREQRSSDDLAIERARYLEALIPDLRRVARRLKRSDAEAEDLTQETLLRLWTRLADPEAEPIKNLRAYAFTTLRHQAGNASRAVQSTDNIAEPSIPEPGPDRVALTQLAQALEDLPKAQADLLRLRGIEGLSYTEIARQTGLPLGTVTSRLARGRAALCKAMGLSPETPVSDLLGRR